MSIARKTYTLAIRDLFDPRVISAGTEALVKQGATVAGNIASDAAGKIAGDQVKQWVDRLRGHFTDHSENLIQAIRQSNERAFATIEIALAGPSFWESTWFGNLQTSATDQALVDTLRDYFAESVLNADPAYLQNCLKQLRRARETGLIDQLQSFGFEELIEHNPFARFDDPADLIDAELALIDDIAREFRQAGFADLANLLAVKPPHGQQILAVAAQFHFRSAVLADEKLRNEFQYVKMERLSGDLADGLRFLSGLMASSAAQIEDVLGGIAQMAIVVDAIHADTRDTHRKVVEMHGILFEFTQRLGMANRSLSPLHQLSMNAADLPKVDDHIRKFGELPAPVRRQHSSLSLAVSREAWVAGRFEDSRRIARELAAASKNPLKKAEGYHLAYRNSLELSDFEAALDDLQESIRHDRSFQPFDLDRYVPETIIGSGAFAVAFRCRDSWMAETVVVKAFEPAGLELSPAEIFREAQILKRIGHPNIIGLQHCDYADRATKSKPYLVLEHIDGSRDLERFLKELARSLTLDELLQIAMSITEGMKAAHATGVLHRDIKPANVLVKKDNSRWEVKIIDFGLAMRQEKQARSQFSQISASKSLVGSSLAGTPDYAAPEQLDPDRLKEIGPHSDIYAFGRLCYAALLAHPHPEDDDKDTLDLAWKRLLRDATSRDIKKRLKTFDEVLERLQAIAAPKPVAVVQPPPQPAPAPQPRPAATTVPPSSNWQGQKAGDRKLLKLDKIEIPLRWCPPVKFRMGSPKTEEGRFNDEDQVDVTLTKGFWIMETPVTQGLWQAVTGEMLRWSDQYGLGPNFPAYDPDWAMANDFAAKMTQKLVASGQMPSGMKLALPTEAQWEYACRAGTTTRFPFGEDPAKLTDHAWFGDNSGSRVIDAQKIWDADPVAANYSKKIIENGCKSHPVAEKLANAWGLHDMLGNVWEWCADWYGEKLPGDVDPVGPPEASNRVLRGGSWFNNGGYCRSAIRSRFTPESRNGYFGFRVAAVRSQ